MKRISPFVFVLYIFMLVSCQETEITETKAIELSKTYLESTNSQDFIKLITNYDSPSVEKLDFDDVYTVFYFGAKDGEPEGNNLKGKRIWKISYSHTLENLLGSYTIYIDRYSGRIYGTDLLK